MLNDVQLQINALKNYPKESMFLIGNDNDYGNDTKILIVPGTGLGLGILNNNNSIATEAGHINLPNNDSFLKKILETFYKEHNRAATFEDLLSEKEYHLFIVIYQEIRLTIFAMKIFSITSSITIIV